MNDHPSQVQSSYRKARSMSISDGYSSLFSQPNPSQYVGRTRHPSLSISPGHGRRASITSAMLSGSIVSSESAIDDSYDAPPPVKEHSASIGRTLSQGARAMMFGSNNSRVTGNRFGQPKVRSFASCSGLTDCIVLSYLFHREHFAKQPQRIEMYNQQSR